MWFKGNLLPGIVVAAVLAYAPASHALDPDRHLTQLHHTAWTLEAGAPPDERALAQTPDGFLWIGSGGGLFRFDGIRFEKLEPRGDQMPAVAISSLLALPSGDLWIGYDHGGVARLRNGVLTNMSAGLPRGEVVGLTLDHNGTVWLAIEGDGHPGLARFVGARWQVVGPGQGLPNNGVRAMLFARNGTAWVESKDEIFLLRPGAQRFVDTGQRSNGPTLIEGPGGRIWATARWAAKGLGWIVAVPDFDHDPNAMKISGLYRAQSTIRGFRTLADRDDNLWITTSEGVFRIRRSDSTWPSKGLDRFSARDGLTSDLAGPILEDREGDIWVGTNLGLDRFRAADAASATGISSDSPVGFWVAADKAGGVFVATSSKLYRAYANRRAEFIASRDPATAFLFTDAAGALWLGSDKQLAYFDGNRLKRVSLPPAAAGDPVFISQDAAGAIWISVWANGVFHQTRAGWRKIAVSQYPLQPAPDQLVPDATGRIWMKFHGILTSFDNGKLRTYSTSDGLSVGYVQLIVNGRSELLVAGDDGLARYDGQRFQTITHNRIPEFLRISGVVETKRGDTWINGIDGVVRMRTKDLDWAFDHPNAAVPYRVFTLADGLPGVAQQDSDSPTAVEAADGRIWLVTNRGVAWIDPTKPVRDLLAPPVTIRSVTTGGQTYAPRQGLELPPGSSSLQIDYTALSLAMPERVQFRYRLAGVDRSWINPGGRRQAFYTNVGSGRYVFQVIAQNSDGIWNYKGATLNFEIEPTFLQSYYFYLLCIVVFIVALWILYFVRLRQLTARIQAQMEVRVKERERIARVLHDTLLQGFQGVVLRFQAVAEQLPPADGTRHLINDALARADKVLVDGRIGILDLRSADRTLDLSEAIAEMGEKLALKPAVDFRVVVEGEPRPIDPVVSSEIQNIGQEALFNVYRHARARSVEVSVTYHRRELRVLFRDDGVGISTEFMASGGKNGHFGLTGMRERAESIHGQLVISSRKGRGTEIGLRVPAEVAYADNANRRWLFPIGGPWSPKKVDF